MAREVIELEGDEGRELVQLTRQLLQAEYPAPVTGIPELELSRDTETGEAWAKGVFTEPYRELQFEADLGEGGEIAYSVLSEREE